MSAEAQVTAARNKQKAIEKLSEQRTKYLQPFEATETQQKQASSKLATQAMRRDWTIRKTMADGEKAGQALREVIVPASKRMNRLDTLLQMSYRVSQPREFQTLAELHATRTAVQKQRAEVETLASQLSDDLVQIDKHLNSLTNTLGTMLEPLDQAVGLVDVWDFQARMGALLASAKRTVRAVEGDLDTEKPAVVAAAFRFADERLGGVQIQVARIQKLMNEYDALVASPPLRLRNDTRRAKNLKALAGAFKEIKKAMSAAQSRGRWSYHLQVVTAQEKAAWAQAGHNGFGVVAYERWLEAEAIWKRLAIMQRLLRQQKRIEDWLTDLQAKRNEMGACWATLRKPGWWIGEVANALEKRQNMPAQARTLAALLRQARQIEKTRAGFAKLMADSVLHSAIRRAASLRPAGQRRLATDDPADRRQTVLLWNRQARCAYRRRPSGRRARDNRAGQRPATRHRRPRRAPAETVGRSQAGRGRGQSRLQPPDEPDGRRQGRYARSPAGLPRVQAGSGSVQQAQPGPIAVQ
jgi:hypothetical protein